MSDAIEVRRGKIRVEFLNLEDNETPNTTSKWYGVWSASFSFHRKKVLGGRELDVWKHWFTLPTTLKLDAQKDQMQACGDKLLSTLEFSEHLLPNEDKDFGPNPKVNPILLSQLTDIANGKA
jgi:hypothetical protein